MSGSCSEAVSWQRCFVQPYCLFKWSPHHTSHWTSSFVMGFFTRRFFASHSYVLSSAATGVTSGCLSMQEPPPKSTPGTHHLRSAQREHWRSVLLPEFRPNALVDRRPALPFPRELTHTRDSSAPVDSTCTDNDASAKMRKKFQLQRKQPRPKHDPFRAYHRRSDGHATCNMETQVCKASWDYPDNSSCSWVHQPLENTHEHLHRERTKKTPCFRVFQEQTSCHKKKML